MLDSVERAGPPRHHEAEQPGDGHADQADETELDGQPSRAGDALGPREAEGAGFEFTGDERRTPEDPDERRGDDEEKRHERRADAVVWLTNPVVTAEQSPPRGLQFGRCRVVEVDEVRAGHRQHDGDDRQGAEGEPWLGRGTGSR